MALPDPGTSFMLSQNTELDRLIAKAYSEAYCRYGDLNVSLETFGRQVRSIVTKHLGSESLKDQVNAFVTELHTSDLYLATGCAEHSETAWHVFISNYRRFIGSLA